LKQEITSLIGEMKEGFMLSNQSKGAFLGMARRLAFSGMRLIAEIG
jgi:hypothetical protein